MRILIVRLSALGDVTTGLAVLASLKAACPEAFIGWLVEDRCADLLRDHPQIDQLHVFDRRHFRRVWLRPWNLLRLLGFVKSVRKQGYDAALDLQGNLKSGVFTRLSGAKRSLGMPQPHAKEGNDSLVREQVPVPGDASPHRLEPAMAMVRALFPGAAEAPIELPVTPEPGDAVILHPATSRFATFKQWPAKSFAALADRLATELSAPIWLTAGPGEAEIAEEVRKNMVSEARVVSPAGLKELQNTLAGARLVVAADTGPAHIAAALGVPTLTLFGPKDPEVLRPVGPRSETIAAGVRCSPCALRHCPDPICMTSLTVDAVAAAALALVKGPR